MKHPTPSLARVPALTRRAQNAAARDSTSPAAASPPPELKAVGTLFGAVLAKARIRRGFGLITTRGFDKRSKKKLSGEVIRNG